MESELSDFELETIMDNELEESLDIIIESQIENERFKKRGIEI